MAATTLVASAARTTSGTSSAIPVGSNSPTIELEIETTAVSGTSPSMAMAILWSVDGVNFGSNDGAADAFAAITATGNVTKLVTVRAPYMQLSWTLTGTTPSFTFSVLDTTSNAI